MAPLSLARLGSRDSATGLGFTFDITPHKSRLYDSSISPRLSASSRSRPEHPRLLERTIEIVPPKHNIVGLVVLVLQPEYDFGLDAAAALQINLDRRAQRLDWVARRV
jgi:hypothetical protein